MHSKNFALILKFVLVIMVLSFQRIPRMGMTWQRTYARTSTRTFTTFQPHNPASNLIEHSKREFAQQHSAFVDNISIESKVARFADPQNKIGTVRSQPGKVIGHPGGSIPLVQTSKFQVDTTLQMDVPQEEFQNLDISLASRKAIGEVMKYRFLTPVQSVSLPIILAGRDCLAKAKTGTGKTLGFLIPAVELMHRNEKQLSGFDIPILIISPSRELAIQIAEEAKSLLEFHNRKNVLCFYGGVKVTKDHRDLYERNVTIMVATPGRLNDHLQNTPGFRERLSRVRMVILDEADQLLDLGFKPAIDQIFASLPKADKRQTLLFSATVPQSVRDIASTTLKPGYAFLDTVGEQDAEQTHSHVPQELVIMQKMSDLIPTIAGVLQKQMNLVENYKILVFFNTARVAGFMADMFKAMRWPVIEMHSRMSQGARTKASDAFRASDRVIMFSSDVSARGMDYPGVSFVLQVGSTEKAQYIHRLGRTARAGKEGAGMLLLQAFEERAMKNELKGLPLRHIQYLDTTPSLFTTKYQPILANVNSNAELKRSAEQAFQSWLGYYNGKLRALGWSKLDLVRFANDFCRSCGLNEMPSMDPKIVGKMGLKGTPGLRISPSNR